MTIKRISELKAVLTEAIDTYGRSLDRQNDGADKRMALEEVIELIDSIEVFPRKDI